MDRKVKYMQFFFLIVGSLFVYCWYGEKISKESKSIGDSLYNTDWYNMTKDFKYLVIQMIFRSQKPIYITAWGFINATLQSYTAVREFISKLTSFPKLYLYILVIFP